MPKEALAKLWLRAWSTILVEMTTEEVAWLFWPGGHLSLLSTRRIAIIVMRTRLVAALFAVLTPLWIIIDAIVFAPAVWHGLAWARVAASVAFGAILLTTRRAETLTDAYKALGFLLAIPSAFFLFSYEHMALFDLRGIQGAIATSYIFLPFVMLAGLSIFPLTLVECIAFAIPMLLMPGVAALLGASQMDLPGLAVMTWLLLLIVSVSALAGVSQLGFMIVFIREAIHDGMTACFTRNSGEELLDLQFVLSSRINTPLTLAFIDLDYFKSINDRFGHDAGDRVLKNAAVQLRSHLRAGDILARWGGDEFLLIMPNTNAQQACQGLQRVCDAGLGRTPDAQPVTASIGVAERQADATKSWSDRVDTADARMYAAKKAGRKRIAGCGQLRAP